MPPASKVISMLPPRIRQEIERRMFENGFRDYDGLVPAELWGTWYKSSDPDFSHFTAAGHRLLAAQVRADAAPLIDGTSAALSAPGQERTGAVQ